jgi:hypothetical protein
LSDVLFFPKRAVNLFVDAANKRIISPRHLKEVLKYKNSGVDVSCVECFLKSKDDFVRKYASRIISIMGDTAKVVEAVKEEQNKSVLLDMFESLSMTKSGTEELVYMLDESEDPIIKQAVIDMFRRSERADCLISLLFSDDDALVCRVKRWMKELDNG